MSDEPRPRVTRRTMLAATAGVVAAAPLLTPALEAAAVRVFSAAELALVDELSEIIVPTDAHSPGARAAGVAAYLDARLAESFDEQNRTAWRTGLTAVEALSTTLHGKPFLKGTPSERLAVVTKMAEAEAAPKTDAERFFVLLKNATIRVYYTSKIGVLQEME